GINPVGADALNQGNGVGGGVATANPLGAEGGPEEEHMEQFIDFLREWVEGHLFHSVRRSLCGVHFQEFQVFHEGLTEVAQLIDYYLQNKVNGEEVPSELIMECNLYGKEEPWVIFGEREDKELYFFTKLRNKFGKGNRKSRTAGDGAWKGDTTATPIEDCRGDQEILCRVRRTLIRESSRKKSVKQEFKHEEGVVVPRPPTSNSIPEAVNGVVVKKCATEKNGVVVALAVDNHTPTAVAGLDLTLPQEHVPDSTLPHENDAAANGTLTMAIKNMDTNIKKKKDEELVLKKFTSQLMANIHLYKEEAS
ncbi:hypothetical protein FRX31_020866, partial [Thalictrum thalictroides]